MNYTVTRENMLHLDGCEPHKKIHIIVSIDEDQEIKRTCVHRHGSAEEIAKCRTKLLGYLKPSEIAVFKAGPEDLEQINKVINHGAITYDQLVNLLGQPLIFDKRAYPQIQTSEDQGSIIDV